MATTTFSSIPANTNGSTFYLWGHPIAAFLATAGWIQNGDTGQIVWPVTIFNVASASWNGTTATYTGTITAGTSPLRSGASIIVKGCTTGGLNGTFIINGGNLTTTFTATNATAASSETETALAAWGSVNTQVSITNAIGNTASNTFTYSNLDGTLVIGQSVVVTGCTTTGFNATWIVASINTGAGTFTTTTGITHATEVETGTGIVSCIPAVINSSESGATTLPPATTTNLYEIWKMGDGNALAIYLRLDYGTGSVATTCKLTATLSGGTDGAGNATGGSTGAQVVFSGLTTASSFTSYLAGSTNRLHIYMWPGNTATVGKGLLNIERSHDASGNDTSANSYATMTVVGSTNTTNSNVVSQISITASNSTVNEIRLPCIINNTTNTGSFVLSTLLSPVFPVVGAVGNPLIGIMVGKNVDWADLTQFPYTIYSVSHNFIIFNNAAAATDPITGAGVLTYATTPTCCLAMRYE